MLLSHLTRTVSDSPSIISLDDHNSNPLAISYTQLGNITSHISSCLVSFVSQQQKEGDQTEARSELPDSIAIVIPNSAEFVVSFLGVCSAGFCTAPLNQAYSTSEFVFYLKDISAKCIIISQKLYPNNSAIKSAAKDLKIPILDISFVQSDEPIVRLVNLSDGGEIKPDAIVYPPNEDDIAMILHTSGTTGRPKMVPLTHKNLMVSCSNIASTYSLSAADRSLIVMPLFHVHGLVGCLLSSLYSHGSVVIPPKFSATKFLETFLHFDCTWYSAVPTIHKILLTSNHLDSNRTLNPYGRLRFVRSCSSHLPAETFEKLEKKLKVPVLEALGMTEGSHQVTSNPQPPAKRVATSAGIPQGTHVSILPIGQEEVIDENKVKGSGVIGEICIKGPSVTKGYLCNPTANASSFTPGGWFRTGDQGNIGADGYLFILGRIKELINRAGEKISPIEIESVLLRHPYVNTCIVFPLPHDIYGQEIYAVVIPSTGEGESAVKANADEAEKKIKQFCGQSLATFKVPKRILFASEMPGAGATGKIKRNVVAQHFSTTILGATATGQAKL